MWSRGGGRGGDWGAGAGAGPSAWLEGLPARREAERLPQVDPSAALHPAVGRREDRDDLRLEAEVPRELPPAFQEEPGELSADAAEPCEDEPVHGGQISTYPSARAIAPASRA